MTQDLAFFFFTFLYPVINKNRKMTRGHGKFLSGSAFSGLGKNSVNNAYINIFGITKFLYIKLCELTHFILARM